jgi:hypothetical protein
VISAGEKIMEAGETMVAFFQESRADLGKVSTIQ